MESKSQMHEKILQSALNIFSRKGFADATIKDISSLAGCNAITVFRHFEDKEKLFYSVVKRFYKIELNENEINLKLSYTDINRDLKILADVFFEIIFEHHNILRIFINDSAYFEEIRKYVWFVPEPLKIYLINYLNKMYPETLDNKDAELISEMFIVFILRCCLRYGVHEGMWELDADMWRDYRELSGANIIFITDVLNEKTKSLFS